MNAKIKYNVEGLGQVEVAVDPSDIQDKKGREEYRSLHSFLTGVLSGVPAPGEMVRDTPARGDSRPHNKSIPHFKADRRLAKLIIDKGGLKFLHGVNIINKKQVFFFDRVPMVQDIIERYNMQVDVTLGKSNDRKAVRKHGKAGKAQRADGSVTKSDAGPVKIPADEAAGLPESTPSVESVEAVGSDAM